MKLDRFILLLSLTAALPACKGASPVFHDMALPADCDSRCPAGYTCDNGVCTGGNARALALDTATFPVSGTLLVNGAPPQATTSTTGGSCSSDQVNVQFADGPLPGFFEPTLSTIVETSIACSDSSGAVMTRLPAGSYRMLAHGYSGTTFPSSTITMAQNLQVKGPVTGAMWNTQLVTVSGTLTVDGAPPTATTSCYSDQVELTFVDDNGSSYEASIPCKVSTGAFSLQLAPGSYRVLAHAATSYTSFPPGTFVVNPALQVSGSTSTLALAATTVAVSGTLTLDGAPPTATSSCSSDQVTISFSDAAGSSFSASIPCTVSTGAFTAKVAPGTYKVTAHSSSSYTSFPSATTLSLDPAFKVAGPTSGVTWAPKTVALAGTLTVDGAPPLPTSSCSGDQVTLTLMNDDGASFDVGIPCVVATGAFSTKVVPGTYRVLARGSNGHTSFPDGSVVVQRALTVSAPLMGQKWAVTTVPVMGTLQIDGAFPLPTSACSGDQVAISFVDDDGALFDTTIPCLVSTGAFSLKVTPGTYKVLAHGYSNTSFPADSTFTLINALRVE